MVTLSLGIPQGPDTELFHLKLLALPLPKIPPRQQGGAGRGKRPYTPARGPSTDTSPGAGQGWQAVTGGSRGLLSGAGAPYLAVGRRGSLRVQLPAASKGEREKRVKTSRPLACPFSKHPGPSTWALSSGPRCGVEVRGA